MQRVAARRWVTARSAAMRRSIAALVILVFAVCVTGCATGDQMAGELSRLLADDPAVESVDFSSADNMPFTGGVGGTVTLRDGADDAQVRAVSERIVEFAGQPERQTEEPHARVRVDLVVGDWRFPVLTEPESQASLVDFMLAQRADATVTAGAASSRDYREDVTLVALHLSEKTSAFSAFDDAAERTADAGMSPALQITAATESAGAVELSGRPGPWLAQVQQGYQTIRDALPFTSFRADDEAVTVTVATERDASRAASILEAELSGSGVAAFVQSDLVTLAPGATGATARSVIAHIDQELIAGIETVWTDDRDLSLHLSSTETLEAVAEDIGGDTAAAPFTRITLATGAPEDPTVRLSAAPADLETASRGALKVLALDGVDALRVSRGDSAELVLTDPASDTEFQDLAPRLKSLMAPGDRLCIEVPDDAGFCVIAAPHIDLNEVNDRAAKRGRAFIESWNTAPPRA